MEQVTADEEKTRRFAVSMEIEGTPEALLAMYADLAERISDELQSIALEANALAVQLRSVRAARRRTRRFRLWRRRS